MVIAQHPINKANIAGIAGSMIQDAPICMVASIVTTMNGPVLGIFNQYAHRGKGEMIHSINQLEAFGLNVCDRPMSRAVRAGKQRIKTQDGYIIPLSIKNGFVNFYLSHPVFESRRCKAMPRKV